MKILKIDTNKKRYMDLLLLADEQENMIDAYLERGTLYALETDSKIDETIAVCVVTDESDGVLEIKNIAVKPSDQRMGYGKALIDFIVDEYKNTYRVLQVGTGDVPEATAFYEKCGFKKSHKIENFFTDNYNLPMYESGIQLIDMIYFTLNL